MMITAQRRLQEEMGIECKLQKKFSFVYKVDAGNGLLEHEHDTVLIGKYDGSVAPNPSEASEAQWISIAELIKNISEKPQDYTPWFKIILQRMGYDLSENVSKSITINSAE